MNRARFWLFGGEFAHEPSGGMRDFLRDFADLGHAVAYAEGYLARCTGGWARIWDSVEDKEVWTDAQAR